MTEDSVEDEYVKIGELDTNNLVPILIEYEKGKWEEIARVTPVLALPITVRLIKLVYRAKTEAVDEMHHQILLSTVDKGSKN